MVVVVVFFEIKPDRVAAFREAMVAQARRCLELEPGCRQFDVAEDPLDPKGFFLYEVYDDEAALKAHQNYPHFHEFREQVGDWIASRKILTYRRISAPPAMH